MLQKRETTATTRKKCLTTEKWLATTLCKNFILNPGGAGGPSPWDPEVLKGVIRQAMR